MTLDDALADGETEARALVDVLEGVPDQVVEHLPQEDLVGPYVEEVTGHELPTEVQYGQERPRVFAKSTS